MTEDVDMRPEAKDTDWIVIISTDGFEYMVKRKIANISSTIRSMLDTESNYAEAISRTCPVMQRGIIVEKTLEYMAFRAHYQSLVPKRDIPVQEFLDLLPPEIVLEVLLAADYLDL